MEKSEMVELKEAIENLNEHLESYEFSKNILRERLAKAEDILYSLARSPYTEIRLIAGRYFKQTE